MLNCIISKYIARCLFKSTIRLHRLAFSTLVWQWLNNAFTEFWAWLIDIRDLLNMEIHFKNQQHKCGDCDMIFANNTFFVNMWKYIVLNECSSCGISFKDDESLKDHMKIHNLVLPLQSISIRCCDSLSSSSYKCDQAPTEGNHNNAVCAIIFFQ